MDSSDTGDIGGHHHDGHCSPAHSDPIPYYYPPPHDNSAGNASSSPQQTKPNFKSEFKKGFNEALEPQWLPIQKALNLTEVRSGALHDAAQHLAAKAGVEAPTVFVSKSRIPNAMMLQIGKPRFIVTEGFMQAMGNSSPYHANSEMKATIAHELGHLKRGEGTFLSHYTHRVTPIYGLPIALVIARHIWLRAAALHPNDPHAMAEHIVQNGEANPQPYTQDDYVLGVVNRDKLQSLSVDVALAGTGFVGGNFLARHVSLQSEYACDRIGAELTSPDAMISVLQKLESKVTRDLVKTIPKDDPMMGILKEKPATNWWEVIQQWTKGNMHAHPTTEERIARLQALGADMKAGVYTAVPSARVAAHEAVGVGTLLSDALQIVGKIRV